MSRPDARSVVELVRLPSVLTVPGDALAGAVWAAGPSARRRALPLAAASSLIYLAGMALNDYADREVDARERPRRPIPSGRVEPGFALALAAALTAGGAAVAAAAGGRRSTAVAVPLIGVVWAYDLALKGTAAGPATMAGARALDVLLGASRARPRHALPAAAVVGAHTLVITAVSRREVAGSGSAPIGAALAASAAVSGVAALLAKRRAQDRWKLATAMAIAGAHAAAMARAEARALRDPSPAALQRLVGVGVMAFMPLQAALLAASGAVGTGVALAAAWSPAAALARRIAVA